MAKNFYQYTGPGGQTLHGYQRRYKNHQLRKKGFLLKRDAEKDLRQAMDDIDASERGEIRCKPTTTQEAFDIYKRDQDIRGQAKSNNYKANNNSIYRILKDFVKHFGPNRLIRDCKESDLREFYQILCFRPELHKNTAGSYMSRVQGMMKAAQERKADLANWKRPTLKVNRRTKYERRVVEPWEYATLVRKLLDPLRHTFITHMMEATNKDVKLVMEWSGHKSLESFKIYLHPSNEGRILGSQCVDSVALFLRSFEGTRGTRGTESPSTKVVKAFKRN